MKVRRSGALSEPVLSGRYLMVVRGEGSWVGKGSGHRQPGAMSGGFMAATLGAAGREPRRGRAGAVAGGAYRVRALVIQHEAATPSGPILDCLSDAEAEVVRIDTGHGDIDAGGTTSWARSAPGSRPTMTTVPWIQREARLLREAHEPGTSVPGICFGSHLLAGAFGARCYRADAAEIGWLPVRSRDEGLVSAGPLVPVVL